MFTNILQFLERTVERVPDKPAYVSESAVLTYAQLAKEAKHVGSYLASRLPPLSPVAIIMDRNVWTVGALFGTLYAGCFSSALDPQMPTDRILRVFDTLKPACILVDDTAKALLASLGEPPCMVVRYEDAVRAEIDEARLARIRKSASLYDPIQVFYTSGSTGIPKGPVYTHNNMIAYALETSAIHDIDENTTWGNQAPFFYANIMWDMFPSLYLGGTVYLVPKDCFCSPRGFWIFSTNIGSKQSS